MSMTGFGRGSADGADFQLSVEISSVNRKQLDIGVTLARDLQSLEPVVRKLVQQSADRGRITAKVVVERVAGNDCQVKTDTELFGQYQRALAELLATNERDVKLDAGEILRLPGVLTVEEASADADDLTAPLEAATRQAIDVWNAMRATEGKHLADDLRRRLQVVAAEVAAIADRSPEVVSYYRNVLQERIANAEVDVPLDDPRLVTEVALFADRCDISEETTRLRSHFEKFTALLEGTDPCGRPIDFLLQEMHREVNTIGSKANDAQIAQSVVTCKTELEKIREQVQNIE